MRGSPWLLLPASLLASIVGATNHIVTVGKDSKLVFDPETLPADVGDTITYHFYAKVNTGLVSVFAPGPLTASPRTTQ